MKILNRLEPAFFRQFNHYLLTQHPFIWKTRVQYFLFYSLFLANGLLALIAMFVPVSLEHVPDFDGMFGTSLLVASLGGIVYLLWIFLLNRDSQQLYSPGRAFQALGLYLVAITCLFSNTLTVPLVIKNRVNTLVNSQQLAQDLEHLSYEYWELNRFEEYHNHLRNNESIAFKLDIRTGNISAVNLHLETDSYLNEEAPYPSQADLSEAVSRLHKYRYARPILLIEALRVSNYQSFSKNNHEGLQVAIQVRQESMEHLKNLKEINPEFKRALLQAMQESLTPYYNKDSDQMVLPQPAFNNGAFYSQALNQQLFDEYRVHPLKDYQLTMKLNDLDYFDKMGLFPVPFYADRLFEHSYCKNEWQVEPKQCYHERFLENMNSYQRNAASFFTFLFCFGLALGVLSLQAAMLGAINIQKLALIAALSVLGFIGFAFTMEFSRDLEKFTGIYLSYRHREVLIFLTFQAAIATMLGFVWAFLNKYSGQRTHFLSILQSAGIIVAGVLQMAFWSFLFHEHYYSYEYSFLDVLMGISGILIVWLSFLVQRKLNALPRKN